MSTSFSLPLALAAVVGCAHQAAAQYEAIDLIKGRLFQQSGPSPTPYLTAFGARVLATPGTLTQASVTLPSGQQHALAAGFDMWAHERAFASVSDMDAAYPAGVYTFAITAPHATDTHSLDLPSTVLPPVPAVQNWSAAQAIDPTRDFTLFVEPLTPGPMTAVGRIAIGNFSASIAPGATSIIVPAGTLDADSSGHIQLEYFYETRAPLANGAHTRIAFAVANTATFATIPTPSTLIPLMLLATARRGRRR